MKEFLFRQIKRLIEALLIPFFFLAAFIARFCRKKIDVGLGPEPMINNVYHKQALSLYGYSVETFVVKANFITSDYDYDASRWIRPALLAMLWLGVRSFFRYRVVYIYFNGGPLSLLNLECFSLLRCLEPYFYQLAKVKIVVMPYGGDVQNFSYCPNLLFKQRSAMSSRHFHRRRKIISACVERWTEHADHVISGCDWVDYMYYWDTLMVGHFSIELEKFKKYQQQQPEQGDTFRIFHAPNHRAIKGTDLLVEAVEVLRSEGFKIELQLLEKRPNEEVLKAMAACDLVADQFIIGWYAMFALEAMALGKPVLCYLRQDLIDLYTSQKLFSLEECPIINTPFNRIKERIKYCYEHREEIRQKGLVGPSYVQKTHSLEKIGSIFDVINQKIGVKHG